MSRTAAGAALTAANRRQLLALQAGTIQDLRRLWPVWQFGDRRSWERFVLASTVLVRARNQDAAGLAARYFDAFRRAEGIGGAATIRIAEAPTTAKLAASFAATGLAGTLRARSVGMSLEAARANGFARLAMAAGRHVLNGARDTLLGTTQGDRRAAGWARITSGSPCNFCASLAGEHSAEEAFPAHDGCACTAEPTFVP